MSKFKGTTEQWRCIFTSENRRAIRSERGILMTFWKPTRFAGQDERFERELNETKANQLLCSKAPEMLEMLKDIKDYLGSDKRMEVEQLIKEATEL